MSEDNKAPAIAEEHIERKANDYFSLKVLINVLFIVLGSVIIYLFMHRVQTQAALRSQRENSSHRK